METEAINPNRSDAGLNPGGVDEGSFNELVASLCASQMFAVVQDAISYAEKRRKEREEETRQEGY
jgi:hypothetical protein